MMLKRQQKRLISPEEKTKRRNVMICSRLSTLFTTVMILIVAVATVLIPLASGLNYNGTCDDVQPPWTELVLEKGEFEMVVYSSLYENDDCSGEYWGTGTSMNFEGLNCAPSPNGNGNICFRCINGTISVSHFDGIPSIADINATTNQAYLAQAASTVYINCADGCGYTCYKLGGNLSLRVGWNSNDQPLCSNAPEICPDVAPPQPAASPTTTTSSSSSSSFFGLINVLLSSLGGLLGAAYLLF